MYTTTRKYLLYLWTAMLFSMIVSCGWFSSDHPQAKTGSPRILLSEHEILNYADSVNAVLGQMDKQQSLIYTLGDYSFFVKKYSSNGKTLLYEKNGESDEYKKSRERYYLNAGNLVLYIKEQQQYGSDSTLLQRDYFRNGILFYSEIKRLAAGEEAATVPFHKNQSKETAPDLKLMEQALQQSGKFNLVFEGVADYPKARYLILSRDEVHAYRAALLLEKEDEFAKELISNPEKYKGAKLDLRWKIKNGEEAVYISGRLDRSH